MLFQAFGTKLAHCCMDSCILRNCALRSVLAEVSAFSVEGGENRSLWEIKNGVQEMCRYFVSGQVPVMDLVWGDKTLSIVHLFHEKIGQRSKVDISGAAYKHNPVQAP